MGDRLRAEIVYVFRYVICQERLRTAQGYYVGIDRE